jgi:hypothetical protein
LRNKDAADDDDDLMLTQKTLFEGAVTAEKWQTFVRPRLDVIVQSLSSLITTHAAPRPRSFELVGVDVVLDAQCTPWLLEVNLSPALAKRSVEHTTTIDKMLLGVLDRTVDKWFADVAVPKGWLAGGGAAVVAAVAADVLTAADVPTPEESDQGWRLVCDRGLPPVAHNRLARLAIVGRGLGAPERVRLIDADISIGGAIRTLRRWWRGAIWRRRVRCIRRKHARRRLAVWLKTAMLRRRCRPASRDVRRETRR